ncbi:DRTGG domain-containing protein [Caldanaerovirga acetigignens]|uniref:DRTGG domain-containing protein n=1 Tax=Caldanaerovirga acetigignens TaxID=447595 RepID=A0A1M7KDL4_9FIRM|nr:DRTGG domain-containing protein [Caldanaerovirga acetigignens]SHM63392.1 DRTGG domain-containing protein [Caldanaerovirga acetigignens]
MTLEELGARFSLNLVTKGTNLERKVTGAYASDLLSWVMGHAAENQIWITVQSHPNIVAVAALLGLAGIIVAEGVEVEENTVKKAEEENIPIFSTKMSIFEICGILYNVLSKDREKC